MRRHLLCLTFCVALSACAPLQPPPTAPSGGGFETFNEQAAEYANGSASEAERTQRLRSAEAILQGLPTVKSRPEAGGPASPGDVEALRRQSGALLGFEPLDTRPDVELQAFRLGAEDPETYSVWLARRLVYPGSYRQARELGIDHRRLPVFHVPPSAAR